MKRSLLLQLPLVFLVLPVSTAKSTSSPKDSVSPVPVTVDNFNRAETDLYFGRQVKEAGLGKLHHNREMTPFDQQKIVRMNRDTLYSFGVFDLEAAPVTVSLPDAGKRYMSMQVFSQDHYTVDVIYAPAKFTYTRDKVGTRYMSIAIRTLANPQDPADIKAAHELQDKIQIQQTKTGTFEIPKWDPLSQGKVRDALEALGKTGGTGVKFGKKSEVDPISHLIGTAVGWGGNPPTAAIYELGQPKLNDGKTVHTVTVKDVPVDSFWSITVYNAKGYFEKNDLDVYSVNNLTATPNQNGSTTVQFGGCQKDTTNCLPITPGWNYAVRLYRPRAEIVNGTWKFPEAQPVKVK